MTSRSIYLLSLLTWFGGCRAAGPALSPSVGRDDARGPIETAPAKLGPSAVTAASLLAASSSSAIALPSEPAMALTPRAEEAELEAVPWIRGDDVGYGVAFKDTGNPRGNNVFIGCAGFAITLDASQAWVSQLYQQSLRDRGVRYIYAVQGPADVLYSQLEIGNTRLAASLASHVSTSTNFVLVVAHSSGAYVAHELLNELATGFDPDGVTQGKIVYFDLDGGDLGLSAVAVDRMRRAYFVAAFDPSTNTYSPNQDSMISGGSTFPLKGGYVRENVNNTGCNAGATWCLHMSLITTQPHDPASANGIPDYSDFDGRDVVHAYIDEKAVDAGLAP
jgi:hypothetical protein